MSQPIICPACQSSSTRDYWPDNGRAEFTLRQCATCGWVFTSPWPSEEQLAAAYRHEYYGPASQRFHPMLERLVLGFRRQRARQIMSLHPQPGHALDIGCGRGWTLAALRDVGWSIQGVELNADAARHAQETLGVSVDLGGFTPERYAPQSCDAIILWHVLEHLRSPRETLAAVSRLLRPGGVLALAVPLRSSWQAQFTRHAWFHLDLPRHLWHFSRTDLQQLLAAYDLQIAHENHLAWEQNFFGWLQSVLNLAGIEHNMLYDLLRRESARRITHPWRTHFGQSLLCVLGAAALAPLPLALAIPEQLCKRGATIEIYAQKPT